jgi:hypothetical protein
MTIDETIDIFKREKAHCESHLHFTGMAEKYYKDIQDLIDAYDLSIKMLEKAKKLKEEEMAANKLDTTISNVAYILDSLVALRQIQSKGDCNTCEGGEHGCLYMPNLGEVVRYNCPFYSQKVRSDGK